MIYLLMGRGGMTARELAERFEVTPRTIYRDVEILSGAGIPIYASRGRNGGIRLLDGFTLDRSLLTGTEQNEILFALESLKAVKAEREGELLSRLSGMFRREYPEWISVDFREWDSGGEKENRFSMLKTGILECRLTTFTYYSAAGEKSSRLVEPVRLCFKMGNWYLQAYCRARRDFRTFRISRMENIQLTGEHFIRKKPPELPINSGLADKMVKLLLRISPRAAFRVYDEFPLSGIQKNADGGFTVSVEYPQGAWVYGYLLSFGEELEVLSPPQVRETILHAAEKIEKKYLPAKKI